jgi:acetyl/propionyl-CoA carboxylase alpha subunit
MARALGEYEVRGIKTSIPFFRWLLADEDFRQGRFDTTMLDSLLKTRAGQPFLDISPHAEEVALVATALYAMQRGRQRPGAAQSGDGEARSAWKMRGRLEALR